MPQPLPRIAASLNADMRHPDGTPPYTLQGEVNYVVLVGTPTRIGRIPFTIVGACNEENVRDSIKDVLVEKVNERYPGEQFTLKDVMLFKV